ncbi:MAG: hypothetical protein IMZ44_21245 [Planctomycetes bacterium]|nr:hypothetical protein [Planctomycetota bacterium]
MKPRRLASVCVLAAMSLAAAGRAGTEDPAPAIPPPASAPGPAARPAQSPSPSLAPAAPAGPPAPARTVLLALPSAAPTAYGGKVEFSEKAFPLLANDSDAEAYAAIRAALPLPCRICRAQGKVLKQDSLFVQNMGMKEPLVKRWEEVCAECGGFGNAYDSRYAARILTMVGLVARAAPGAGPDALRRPAAECLKGILSVRTNTFTTYLCERFRESKFGPPLPGSDRNGPTIVRTVGLRLNPDKQVTFTMDVPALVAPIWRGARALAAAGQTVLVVGTAREPQASGEWVVMRLEGELPGLPQPQLAWTAAASQPRPGSAGPSRPAAQALPPALTAGSAPETAPAILLCGRHPACTVPEGRVVVGGLLVGRWTPPGGGSRPCPVILAVLATQAGQEQRPLPAPAR